MMIDGSLFALAVLAAIGCGIVGGVFFGFSTFVMKALARLPAAQGPAAMQSINVAAVSPLFMVALFGTALACLALTVVSLFKWNESYAVYLLVGGALYLVGAFLLTIMYHVPRNEATVEPNGDEVASRWSRFVTGWTAWNHVRTAASLPAAVLLTLALRVG